MCDSRGLDLPQQLLELGVTDPGLRQLAASLGHFALAVLEHVVQVAADKHEDRTTELSCVADRSQASILSDVNATRQASNRKRLKVSYVSCSDWFGGREPDFSAEPATSEVGKDNVAYESAFVISSNELCCHEC